MGDLWLEEHVERCYSHAQEFPFADIVAAVCDHNVEAFRPDESEEDADLLNLLQQAIKAAMAAARIDVIHVGRVNEAGEQMERYVRTALVECGLSAELPRTGAGTRQARGYPDIEVVDPHDRTTYLEVKVVTENSVEQTQRSFYLSVPGDPEGCKITRDARHLLVSYRLKEANDQAGIGYVPVGWILRDLSTVTLQLKHEFNTCNRELYGADGWLATGGRFRRQLRLFDQTNAETGDIE